jgi:hypothetical protein
MDTKQYKHPRTKSDGFHRQPNGLEVNKAKLVALKDISADSSFERNYIQLDYLISRFKHCPLGYYTLDLEIY